MNSKENGFQNLIIQSMIAILPVFLIYKIKMKISVSTVISKEPIENYKLILVNAYVE